MNIYQYIRESRAQRYRTAKAFWKAHHPPFSYEYYSNIERGTKLPNIATALWLCDHLGLNKKKTCFLWARENMPTQESRAFFSWDEAEVESAVPIGPRISLEDTFLINRDHKRLLESSPLYWEVLSFFAMHEDLYFTLPEILQRITIPKQTMLKILGELVHHNLLSYSRKRYAHPKRYMHIPNDREFFRIRNANFLHNSKQLIHGLAPEAIVGERAIRTTINKKITPSHIERAVRHLKFVIGDLVNLKSPLLRDEGIPYSLCVLFCERDFTKRSGS